MDWGWKRRHRGGASPPQRRVSRVPRSTPGWWAQTCRLWLYICHNSDCFLLQGLHPTTARSNIRRTATRSHRSMVLWSHRNAALWSHWRVACRSPLSNASIRVQGYTRTESLRGAGPGIIGVAATGFYEARLRVCSRVRVELCFLVQVLLGEVGLVWAWCNMLFLHTVQIYLLCNAVIFIMLPPYEIFRKVVKLLWIQHASLDQFYIPLFNDWWMRPSVVFLVPVSSLGVHGQNMKVQYANVHPCYI